MSLLRDIYQIIVPEKMRSDLGIMKIKKIFAKKIRSGELGEYVEEINYLVKKKDNRHHMIPYGFFDQYDNLDVLVQFDEDKDLPFVLLDSKRLYFPRKMNAKDIAQSFRNLLAEQSECSPHKYFSDINKPSEESIFVDVGAAEGMIALQLVNHVKKIYIIESERDWVEALEVTFKNYDNAYVLSAFVGSKDEGGIELSKLIDEKKNLIIKMDIEGNEMSALKGMLDLLPEPTNKYAICTYHKYEDASQISKLFEYNGIHYEYSDGYMFMPSSDKKQFPYFRHGVIRGAK